jgi:hypothetical protein
MDGSRVLPGLRDAAVRQRRGCPRIHFYQTGKLRRCILVQAYHRHLGSKRAKMDVYGPPAAQGRQNAKRSSRASEPKPDIISIAAQGISYPRLLPGASAREAAPPPSHKAAADASTRQNAEIHQMIVPTTRYAIAFVWRLASGQTFVPVAPLFGVRRLALKI